MRNRLPPITTVTLALSALANPLIDVTPEQTTKIKRISAPVDFDAIIMPLKNLSEADILPTRSQRCASHLTRVSPDLGIHKDYSFSRRFVLKRIRTFPSERHFCCR